MKRKHKKTIQETNPVEALQESLQRFEPLLSPREFELLQEEVKRPLQPSIRINPFRASLDEPKDWQQKYSWQVSPIPFCGSGFWVDDSNGTPVSQTLEHRLGHYYIQEAASMLPPELFEFDPSNPGLTLDMAASPGGKTTHLVARGLDHGLVLANDSSQGRIPALRIVLQNWGALNSAISQFPGEKFGPWYPETFDRVLLDAPCSMQGLRISESHDVRPVTSKESLSLAKRQTALLTSALQAVKVGGQVVYSTCTLLPEEDEGVVDATLRRFGSAVEIKQPQLNLPSDVSGITMNGELAYLPEVAMTLRLWPHRLGTAGFFACLLQKTASLDLPTSEPPARSLEKTGFVPIPNPKKYDEILREAYGFGFNEVCETYNLVPMMRYDKIFLFPIAVTEQFSELPLQSAGMILGELVDGALIPSHDWVCRFGSQFTKTKIQLNEAQYNSWIRGEDCFDFSYSDERKGEILVVCSPNGLVLGRGKCLKDRLKNLLPRRLV
jgi:16S rRNA (cytosine1407-C5)-methyltransferase